ncbi:unnamed protein product [Ectocarpus sp. 12 AP-2014]
MSPSSYIRGTPNSENRNGVARYGAVGTVRHTGMKTVHQSPFVQRFPRSHNISYKTKNITCCRCRAGPGSASFLPTNTSRHTRCGPSTHPTSQHRPGPLFFRQSSFSESDTTTQAKSRAMVRG